MSCRSVAPSATGPEDRRRRRRRSKEAHNEVPKALCLGNTAGVQPPSLSYGDVLIMLLPLIFIQVLKYSVIADTAPNQNSK